MFVHPTKVLIIEAMGWINRPISASELEYVFDQILSMKAISYHLVSLANDGVATLVEKRKERGRWKRLYILAPTAREGVL
jgi:predicted ArsR family transcriptional regulator